MKEKVLNNFSLKALSVVGAVILWIVIINVYDPSIRVTISGVPIQLVNEQALSDMGYSYEIEEDSKISVYVSGPRSLVSSINASDILATVDLGSVNVFSDYVDIDVKLEKKGSAYAAVEVAPKTTAIKVNIENRSTRTFEIEAGLTGSPADGYQVGDYQISPLSVTITGAQSLIDSISSVKARVDISGATMDLETTAELEIYNTEGVLLSQEKLNMNKNTVNIRVSVIPVKTVDVQLNYRGTPAEGYRLVNISLDRESVMVAGTQAILNELNEIVIPREDIVLDNLRADTIFTLDLSKYVPEGVRIIHDSEVKVMALIRPVEYKEVTVLPQDILLKNIPAGCTATVVTEELRVSVGGLGINLEAVNAAVLSPEVDLNGRTEGVHTLEVGFTLPNGCMLSETYTVRVQIKNSAAQESTAG